MSSVYIVGYDGLIRSMYEAKGWHVASRMNEADLVQFTGGADVTPSLYNEKVHPRTFSESGRDVREKEVYEEAQALALPCVGICRGGQFLNVMNGGKMYQHVDGHAIGGTHLMTDTQTGETLQVTSTHHQMMREGEDGLVVATANESTFKEYMSGDKLVVDDDSEPDVEVVYYGETNTLCNQPHQEYQDENDPAVLYFFNLLKEYLGVEAT